MKSKFMNARRCPRWPQMVAVASSRTESCERHILRICGSHHAADILNTVLFSINQTGAAGEQPLPALRPIPKKKKIIHFFSLLLYDLLRRTGPTTQKKKRIFFFFSKPVNFISSYRRACWAKALGEYNVHVCMLIRKCPWVGLLRARRQISQAF